MNSSARWVPGDRRYRSRRFRRALSAVLATIACGVLVPVSGASDAAAQPVCPGQIIGYRANGIPIRLQAGGSGIAVVQTVAAATSSATAYTASFASNVTAGNTIVMVVTGACGSGSTITSASPTFNSASVTGAVKAVEKFTGSGSAFVYQAIWLLPDVTGGAKGIGITVTNNTYTGGPVGIVAYELSGMGASPSVDLTNDTTGSGSSVTSGASGAITAAPEFIVGSLISYGQTFSPVGSPWTSTQFGNDFSTTGYQIATTSGGSYTYSATAGGSASNVGVIATIKATATPASGPKPIMMALL